MSLRRLANRVLVSHARPEAYVERTVAILGRLGYRIVGSDDWAGEQSVADGGARVPSADLLIVDETRIDEVQEPRLGDLAARPPIVLLTGRHGISQQDPRIVGAVRRPAGLHDLYRIVQQVFEETPRTVPRVPVELRAEAAYQLVPDLGVVFSGLEPTLRASLGDYVAETILAS